MMLIFSVVPVLHRAGTAPELMQSIAKRFGVIAGVATLAIVASGAWMAGELNLWSSNLLHVKLMLVVLIGVLFFLHVMSPRVKAIALANFAVSLVVVWLGLKLTYGG